MKRMRQPNAAVTEIRPPAPEAARKCYERGLVLKGRGHYAEALAELDQALGHDAQFAEAYFLRGVLSYRLGRYRQVVEDMDAAALLGCEVAQLWSRFGRRDDEVAAAGED